MDIFKKQTFYTNLKFINLFDDNKTLTININLSTNHKINNDVLSQIEQSINNILVKDYEDYESYNQRIEEEKEREKEEKELRKELKKKEIKTDKNKKVKKIYS